MKRFIRIVIRTVLFLLIICTIGLTFFVISIKQSEPKVKNPEYKYASRKKINDSTFICGKSWLRKNKFGLWEMYLCGNGYERGVQHGILTRELAEFQEKAFTDQIKLIVPNQNYLQFLKYFVAWFNRKLPQYIKKEYLDEIYGVSLFASDKFDWIAPKYYRILNYHGAHDIGHALQDKNLVAGCTSFSAWGDKSEDGDIITARNFDFYSGENFAKNKLVIINHPDSGYNFLCISWAGFTGVVSGINETGLSVTINAAKSDIPYSAATPISLLAKEILQYASTISEATAIAESRKTFVSESILIGSGKENNAVIIEKTPSKINVYNELRDYLICPNHYQSDYFSNDPQNVSNMLESSSWKRKLRMEELLQREKFINPILAVKLLRDRLGFDNKSIGLANEKSINQLIAHHGIVFRPGTEQTWISTDPYIMGKFICYDLNKILNRKEPRFNEAITLDDEIISEDPFIYSTAFKTFQLFRKYRNYFQFLKSHPNLNPEENSESNFISTNPDSYIPYWDLGNYYLAKGEKQKAKNYLTQALSKDIASNKEKKQIESELLQCQ